MFMRKEESYDSSKRESLLDSKVNFLFFSPTTI